MKAAMLALIVALVLAHPVAAVVIVAAELAVCAVLGWLIWRAVRRSLSRRPA